MDRSLVSKGGLDVAEKKNLLILPGIETRSFGRPDWSLVTILTDSFRFHIVLYINFNFLILFYNFTHNSLVIKS
jgi:hypothetical protein